MLILASAFLALGFGTSGLDQAMQVECRQVYKEWLRLHKTSDAQSHLVIDPREHSMWIEHAGQVHDTSVVALPRGFRWYAFRISNHGIVKRLFPLRLTTPRPDIDEDSSESIFVIAISKDKTHRLSLSAHRSGNTFNVGSFSGIGDVTFALPQTPKAGTPIDFKSFVANQSPHAARPRELVANKDISLRVVRHPIQKPAK